MPNYTSTDIAARITNIIEKRKPFVERLKKVEAHLQFLSSKLGELEAVRQQLMTVPDNAEVVGKLQKIKIPGLQKALERQEKELAKLRTRFDRGTLNIGVVGLKGQGKSTLLKSLSGLSDNEIPALEGEACTAVRSTIYHNPERTYAKVTFHDENSFFTEIIGAYYEELGLGEKPINLNKFASEPLPPPPAETTKKAIYEKRLRNDYYANFTRYQDRLKPDSPRIIEVPKEEIAKYVVHQYDANKSCDYLAVKQVEIFCPFNKSEVEKIALVDIPGLGDLRVGDEKLMLETLGREVDVVLFVRKPDEDRYGWDEKDTILYEKAKKALNDFPDRSFMVLNQKGNGEGSNSKGCEHHQRTIKENKIEVVSCLIADCSNPDKANEVLYTVLQYLADKIEDLDNRYANDYQELLENIQRNLEDKLEEASQALVKFANENIIFKERFKDFFSKLCNGLAKLSDTLKNQCDDEDQHFKAQVDAVIRACESDSGIPDLEKIDKECNLSDFQRSYKAILRIYVGVLRAHLSKHFLSLNKGLKQSLGELKSLVTEVLVTQGHLGAITEARGAEFLKQMTDILAKNQNQLELGFRTLWESQILYEGLIVASIRQHFDELLMPDTANVPSELPNAQDVKTSLEALHKNVVEKCKQTLYERLREPSKIRYFILTEFVDRVIYADGMKEEWDNFFHDEPELRSKVWPEFQRLEEYKKIQQQWINVVQQAIETNKPQSMRFLN
ncbi:MAG: dynamin family protein [Gloeotrichia echinulata GP01]